MCVCVFRKSKRKEKEIHEINNIIKEITINCELNPFLCWWCVMAEFIQGKREEEDDDFRLHV